MSHNTELITHQRADYRDKRRAEQYLTTFLNILQVNRFAW